MVSLSYRRSQQRIATAARERQLLHSRATTKLLRHLLALFENPKNRQDLKAGRWRFSYLPPLGLSAPAGGGVTRIERGAVTERQIKAAAKSNHTVVLGRRAVLTPLGRDTARALGVVVEKER